MQASTWFAGTLTPAAVSQPGMKSYDLEAAVLQSHMEVLQLTEPAGPPSSHPCAAPNQRRPETSPSVS